MSPLRMNGSTSGNVSLDAPAVAGSNTIVLPTGNGSAYQVLRNGATAGSLEYTDKIVSGTAQNSTSGTAIDFTGIPSWVKRVTVMFAGVSTSGTSPILLRLGTSGGIEITGYASTAEFVEDNAVGAGFTAGFGMNNVSVAAVLYHGRAELCFLGSNIWVCQSTFSDATVSVLLLCMNSMKPLHSYYAPQEVI